jgi:hypothetical protein
MARRPDPGQAHIVIDDEGDLTRCAKDLQGLGEARRLVLVDPLHPELERRHRPRRERLGEALGEGAADVERRNQVELARPALAMLETLGKARVEADFIIFDHVAASDDTRWPVKQKRSGSSPSPRGRFRKSP